MIVGVWRQMDGRTEPKGDDKMTGERQDEEKAKMKNHRVQEQQKERVGTEKGLEKD